MTTHTDRIRQMGERADEMAAAALGVGTYERWSEEFASKRDAAFAQLVAEDCARMCAERAALMKMAAEQANNTQPGSVPQQILSAREVEARNCGQDIIDRYSLKD